MIPLVSRGVCLLWRLPRSFSGVWEHLVDLKKTFDMVVSLAGWIASGFRAANEKRQARHPAMASPQVPPDPHAVRGGETRALCAHLLLVLGVLCPTEVCCGAGALVAADPRTFGLGACAAPCTPPREREFFIANLLVRIHFIIVMIRWTGLAPWEFEFPFRGSLTPTFLCQPASSRTSTSRRLHNTTPSVNTVEGYLAHKKTPAPLGPP